MFNNKTHKVSVNTRSIKKTKRERKKSRYCLESRKELMTIKHR